MDSPPTSSARVTEMQGYTTDDEEGCPECCLSVTGAQSQQCECQCHRTYVAPREKCQSCHANSGPTFVIRDPERPSYRLRNNIMPVGAEREFVVTNIERLESERRGIYEEITRLQQSLWALEYHCKTVDDEIMQEKSLLSPIRKLPDEILRQIFLEAHLEAGGVMSNGSESGNRWGFPHVASRVSSHWRTVAQSYPTLWSTFRYTPRLMLPGCTDPVNVGKYVQHCISLSKEMPLDITLERGFKGPIDKDVIKALGQSVHRWKKATIGDAFILKVIEAYTTYDFARLEILEVPASKKIPWMRLSAPRLRSLSLSGEYSNYLNIELKSAPSLIKISVKDFSGDWDFQDPGYPWTQIRHLELHDNYFYTSEQLSWILERMPQLTSLRLTGENSRVMEHHGAVTIPTIESLAVNSENIRIDMFVAPNLHTLEIGMNVEPVYIRSFLRQSSCSLEKLILRDPSHSDDRESKKLLDAPYLEGLSSLQWLAGLGVDDIRKLGRPKARKPRPPKSGMLKKEMPIRTTPKRDFFPQLETLYIRPTSYTSDKCKEQKFGKTLISTLRSRFPPDHGTKREHGTETYLKSVCIYVGTLPKRAVALLEGFVTSSEVQRSGVDIRIIKGY